MPDLLSSSTVPLAPNASTTQTVLPDWYTNYATQILSNQQQVSQNPFPTYQAPRIADFTPGQQAGFAATNDAAGAYQPALTQAQGALSAVQAAPTASAAANPYLTQADQTSASNVNGYLNPYISNVTDQIARLGDQNLTQNILPAIGDQFVGAGGYGGSRDAMTIGNAIRATQGDITSQQGAALAQGYNGALTASQTDLARQGALAGTAGGLAATDASTGINTAGALDSLGANAQNLGLAGASAITGVGAQQQALNQQNLTQAYNDFQAQASNPQTQINNSVATLNGVNAAVPKATETTGYGPVSAGTTLTPSTAQGIASLLGALGTSGILG